MKFGCVGKEYQALEKKIGLLRGILAGTTALYSRFLDSNSSGSSGLSDNCSLHKVYLNYNLSVKYTTGVDKKGQFWINRLPKSYIRILVHSIFNY